MFLIGYKALYYTKYCLYSKFHKNIQNNCKIIIQDVCCLDLTNIADTDTIKS